MADQLFALADGRNLGISTHGNPVADRVVVFCHPAPGSGVFDPDPTVSESSNAHIIAIDRPGYGSSDPLPPGVWPSVAQAADDIAEFLRARSEAGMSLGEGAEKSVSAVGWSAGGRVALALAARHPQLISRVAVIGTPAPNDAVGWIPKPLAEQSEALSKLPAEQAFETLTNAFAQQAAAQGVQPSDPPPPALLGIRDVDEQVLLGPGVRDRVQMMLEDAVRQGSIGQVTDLLAYTAHPWGFEVSEVKAETLLVYGRADEIGLAHGDWYASQLANVSRYDVDGVGHLVVVPAWGRVLDFLTGRTQPLAH
jgi:pimeloyl-ACP methyl ester carboxylesterase